MSEGDVDGYPRQVWWNADGETIVESYTITDMAHGTPLGIGDNDKKYGTQGAFLIEPGISYSYHIASFFGLTEWIRRSKVAQAEVSTKKTPAEVSTRKISAEVPARKTSAEVPMEVAKNSPAIQPAPDLTSVLWPRKTLDHAPNPPRQPHRRAIDVSAVITRALTAAGLMK